MAESNENDEILQTIRDTKLEKCIVGVIRKIRKGRNRPCFPNVHTLVNRGGKNISMERLK